MTKLCVKYGTLFLFLWALHPISSAQENIGLPGSYKIDSLKNVLKSQRDDTNKVNILNAISYEFISIRSNYYQADSFGRIALSLSAKLNFPKGSSMAYGNLGMIYDYQSNYPEALKYQAQSLDIAEKIGYKLGIGKAYQNIGIIYSDQSDYPEALKNYSPGLKVMEEIGDKKDEGYIYQDMGVVNYQQGDYIESLKNLLQSLKISEELGAKEDMGSAYLNMGNIYTMQGNYPEAEKDYGKAEELGEKKVVKEAYANMGFIYDKAQHNFPEALKSQRTCLKISEEMGDKRDMAGAYQNIGSIYTDEANYLLILKNTNNDGYQKALKDYNTTLDYCYQEALENNLQSLELNKQVGNKHKMADTYINIGADMVAQKKYPEARRYIDSAILIGKNIASKEVMRDCYSVLCDLNSAIGNYKDAYTDYDRYITYRDSITNDEDIKKTAKMQAEYEFGRKEDSVKAAREKTDIVNTAEIRRKSIITYSMVVILLLSLISATLLISRQQIKHRKDKIIFEKNLVLSENKNNLLKIEKQLAEDELAGAKALLDEHVKNLVEKNELLEQFKHDFEELKKMKSKELDEKRIEDIEYLNKTTILTEEDWDKFKELFEQVHKGFFIRLKEKLPDLTNAEMRLVCLTKLKLDTKEMAGILGVSFATIRQSRYRLRKKIGLMEEDTIDDIVESI